MKKNRECLSRSAILAGRRSSHVVVGKLMEVKLSKGSTLALLLGFNSGGCLEIKLGSQVWRELMVSAWSWIHAQFISHLIRRIPGLVMSE